MRPEHYDTYAAARSALAELARISPEETFEVCHELLLELDSLHPEVGVTEIAVREHAERADMWQEAKRSVQALAGFGVDRLRVALLIESLERAQRAESSRGRRDTRPGQ